MYGPGAFVQRWIRANSGLNFYSLFEFVFSACLLMSACLFMPYYSLPYLKTGELGHTL